MKNIRKGKKVPKQYKYMVDHNPYEILSYNNNSSYGKVIIFPVFHYEGERQYFDLINPVIEKGYHDNITEEGISSFATSLLSHIAFSDSDNSDDSNDSDNIPLLEDYYGKYEYEAGDTFTNFRFDILNS